MNSLAFSMHHIFRFKCHSATSTMTPYVFSLFLVSEMKVCGYCECLLKNIYRYIYNMYDDAFVKWLSAVKTNSIKFHDFPCNSHRHESSSLFGPCHARLFYLLFSLFSFLFLFLSLIDFLIAEFVVCILFFPSFISGTFVHSGYCNGD